MRQWSGREVIAELLKDGWYEVNCEDSHHQFKHPSKKGRVTVKAPCTGYPKEDARLHRTTIRA